MPHCKSPYDAREDSTLLKKHVRALAYGSVLDMGTGSGIQAITAALQERVTSVIALDIQKEVIAYCKKNISNRKIQFLVSDLFSTLEKNKVFKNVQFDTIIFNPPYLPQELKVRDVELEGGKEGYETLERFLSKISQFLKKEGICLILFSSLTKKKNVDDIIKRYLLEFELLESQRYFFEELFVYKVTKSPLLKTMEEKDIKNARYFNRGKRGFIFTGLLGKKKIAMKVWNKDSRSLAKTEHEANILEKINKQSIGPKLILGEKDFFAYEFVDGIEFLDFIEKNNNKKTIKSVIEKIFEQLYVLDSMNLNKEEMSHPHKHILITKKNEPVLIDFERARYAMKPGNVTQFCDFLSSKEVNLYLGSKNILVLPSIIEKAKEYKREMTTSKVKNIIDSIQ